MTDTFSVEQESIEDIGIGGQSVPVGLPGVEEELNLRVDGVQFVRERSEGLSFVLLTDQVETSYKVRIISLQLRHYFQIIIHLFGVNVARRRVYELNADEIRMVARKPVLHPFITSACLRGTCFFTHLTHIT